MRTVYIRVSVNGLSDGNTKTRTCDMRTLRMHDKGEKGEIISELHEFFDFIGQVITPIGL